MSVNIVNGVEIFDDEGIDPDKVTNQHYISAARQIREMLLNGELYARHVEGLDLIDDEAEQEAENDESSPFTYNRVRVDDEIIENIAKADKLVRKKSAKRNKVDSKDNKESTDKTPPLTESKEEVKEIKEDKE